MEVFIMKKTELRQKLASELSSYKLHELQTMYDDFEWITFDAHPIFAEISELWDYCME